MKIVWLRSALNDLKAVEDFIGQDNPEAARETAQAIRAAVSLLRDQPEIGRPGRVAGTRELVVPTTRYIVAYAIEEDVVAVLAILHGARKWPGNF